MAAVSASPAAATQATQQTQTQTQESDAYAMYDSSFDIDRTFARFVSLTNVDRVPTLVLPRREPGHVYKFGRHGSCDYQLVGGRFSNVHFKVWEEVPKHGAAAGRGAGTGDVQSVIMLQDTSTNGTFLNQARIGKGNMTVLSNGDEIAAGVGVTSDEVRFLVQLPPASRLVQKSGLASLGSSSSSGAGLNAEAQRCMAKYEIRQILGAGAFATVRVCVDRSTGTRYAVKILNQRKLAITNASAKAAELFRREIEILQSTRHPNIVQYVDMWHDARDIYLVLEYLDGGDLMDYIMRRGSLDEYGAVSIVAQVLEALAYCHRIGIAHRDIKPENILLTAADPPQAKLTDFGLAKMVEPGSFLKTFCGTLTYVAPEVISMHGRVEGAYSTAVDMWSVGCVAFICVAGSMPFVAEGQEAMMRAISAGDFDVDTLESLGLSVACVRFVESCLKVDPAMRITGDAALAHLWITEADARHAEQNGLRRQGGGWTGDEEYDGRDDGREDEREHNERQVDADGGRSQPDAAARAAGAGAMAAAPSINMLDSPGVPSAHRQRHHNDGSVSVFGYDKSPFRVPLAKENRPPSSSASAERERDRDRAMATGQLRHESTVTPLKKGSAFPTPATGAAAGAGGVGGFARPVTPSSHPQHAHARALGQGHGQSAKATAAAGPMSRFSSSEEESPLRRSTLMPSPVRSLPRPSQLSQLPSAPPAAARKSAGAARRIDLQPAARECGGQEADNEGGDGDAEADSSALDLDATGDLDGAGVGGAYAGGFMPGSSRYVSALDFRPVSMSMDMSMAGGFQSVAGPAFGNGHGNGHGNGNGEAARPMLQRRALNGDVLADVQRAAEQAGQQAQGDTTGYVTAPLADTMLIRTLGGGGGLHGNVGNVGGIGSVGGEKRGVVRPRDSDDSLADSLDIARDARSAGVDSNGIGGGDEGERRGAGARLERRETKRPHL